MALFDNTSFRFLEQGLGMTWQKQKIISQNIANDSTPDYKARTVDFKVVLEEKCKCVYHPETPHDEDEVDGRLIGKSGGKSPFGLEMVVTVENNTNQTLDGNNVDIEKEAIALADAQLQYNTLSEKIMNEFSMVRTALSKTT